MDAFFDLDRRDLRYSLETVAVAGRSFLGGILRNILSEKKNNGGKDVPGLSRKI